MVNSNRIYTERSQLVGNGLEVRVRTDDDGNDNQAHLHVWDKQGNTKDVPIAWERKVWGSDDLFQQQVPLDALAPVNPREIAGATAFVQFSSGYRVWEGQEHKVEVQRKDVQVPTDRGQGYGYVDAARSLETQSGPVELQMVGKTLSGYKSAYGLTAVAGVRFTDVANRFQGAPEIHVLLMPIIGTFDPRIDYSAPIWNPKNVQKELLDSNLSNLITLKRGDDGAYSAKADADKSFLALEESRIYMGPATSLKAIRFALVGPGDAWDNNGGRDYRLDLGQ